MMSPMTAGRSVVLGFALLGGASTLLGCDGSAMGGGDAGDVRPPVTADPAYLGTLPMTASRYRIVRGRGDNKGAEVRTAAEVFDELSRADAVCLGELHDDDDHHAVQLLALEQMVARAPAASRRIAVGLEMVQRQFQPDLDDYGAGRIDEATMLIRVQWKRWGFDFSYYRPLVGKALEGRAALLALNANEELRRRVSRVGIAGLTVEERAEVPELDLLDAEHRAWFNQIVGMHLSSDPAQFERSYTVQVLWDETMADLAWQWLAAQGSHARQVAILAGTGHCMDLGIPKRLRRRGADKVLSVKAVREDAQARSEALALIQKDEGLLKHPLLALLIAARAGATHFE
mgnify:CR=1 FL=1